MAGKELTWDDAESIGIAICEQHPELDPDRVTLQDVHRFATLLPQFKGDPADLNESKLAAIRSAWAMEFLDRTQ